MPRLHQDTCCRIKVVSTSSSSFYLFKIKCIHLSPSIDVSCIGDKNRRQNCRHAVSRPSVAGYTKGYKSTVTCIYTRIHVARKHVSRRSNLYPDTYMSTDSLHVDGYKLLVRDTYRLYLGDIINIHICHVCFTWLKVKWRTKTKTMNCAIASSVVVAVVARKKRRRPRSCWVRQWLLRRRHLVPSSHGGLAVTGRVDG